MGILITRRIVLKSTLPLGLAGFVHESSAAEPLVVAVSPSVDQQSFSESELRAIFTTRKQNYEGGARIIPLNLAPKTDPRVRFDEHVLGMKPDEVARYWIDRKVRGGNPPPRHVPSPALMARLLARLPGAIGYVPASFATGLTIVARV